MSEGAKAGVISFAEVNAGPSARGTNFIDVNSPAFWSVVWTVLAVCWLIYVFGRSA